MRLALTVTIKDAGGRSVTKDLWVPISRRDLHIAAFPEAGELVPGVVNRVYVVAAAPGGEPVSLR